MIRPSRGDRKPCTTAGCDGTMHFGRRDGSSDHRGRYLEVELGWSCDARHPSRDVDALRGRGHLTLVPRDELTVGAETARVSDEPDRLISGDV